MAGKTSKSNRSNRGFFDGNATFQGNVKGNSMGGIGDYMRNQTQQGNNQFAVMPQNYGNLPQLNNQLQEQGGMNQFPGGFQYGGPPRRPSLDSKDNQPTQSRFTANQAQASQPSMGQGAQEALEYANKITSGQDNSNDDGNDDGGNDGGGGGGGEQNSGLPYQGIFGLDEIMKGFYGSKPDSDVGKAIKGTFASNFIQSAADHLQAKDMAYTQQGIALTNMKAAANLEKANNAYMMADEYRYGLGTMDAQYNYTNNFANAQYERDLGMLSAKGVDTRKTQDNLSKNRINEMVTGGQQQRLNTQLQGQFDVTRSNIAANASMYGADRSAQASMYGSQKSAEAQMYSAKEAANASRYGADRSAQASMYGSAAARDASMYGSDRSAQASMYGAAQQRDAQMHTADRGAEASMYGSAASRDASMYGSDKNLEGSKYVSDNSLEGSKYTSDKNLEGSKYVSDKNLEGSKYASDASVTNTDRSAKAQEYAADASKTASMYGSDKQLEGIKDTNITSTRNIRTTGDETRKTADQANKFQMDKENRAAARSRAGARRY